MARFGIDDAENYGAVKGNYFSLKDDGDTGNIRFLYNDSNDVKGVATHEVQVGDKKIDVECLRAYNEPVHNCPLCEAGYKVNAKLFIPVYDIDNKESKIWSRGRTFMKKLSSICAKFNPLVSVPFEVERIGKKGDTSTEYMLYPGNPDNKLITDFPEIEIEGIAFQVKTYDELVTFLNTGYFGDDEQPKTERHQSNKTTRETPANSTTPVTPVRRRPNYNNEESF